MSKINFYAVRAGHKPGLYKTWDECKAQITDFKGAVYKGFATEADALEWIKLEGGYNTPREIVPVIPVDSPYAYTDGSFNVDTGKYGYGVVLSINGTVSSYSGSGSTYPEIRNVAGELRAAMEVVKIAFDAGCKSIMLFFDYSGVEKWVDGSWARNNTATEAYCRFMQKYIQKGMTIEFYRIPGHSGIYGNEVADKLAKAAVGIR